MDSNLILGDILVNKINNVIPNFQETICETFSGKDDPLPSRLGCPEKYKLEIFQVNRRLIVY